MVTNKNKNLNHTKCIWHYVLFLFIPHSWSQISGNCSACIITYCIYFLSSLKFNISLGNFGKWRKRWIKLWNLPHTPNLLVKLLAIYGNSEHSTKNVLKQNKKTTRICFIWFIHLPLSLSSLFFIILIQCNNKKYVGVICLVFFFFFFDLALLIRNNF